MPRWHSCRCCCCCLLLLLPLHIACCCCGTAPIHIARALAPQLSLFHNRPASLCFSQHKDTMASYPGHTIRVCLVRLEDGLPVAPWAQNCNQKGVWSFSLVLGWRSFWLWCRGVVHPPRAGDPTTENRERELEKWKTFDCGCSPVGKWHGTVGGRRFAGWFSGWFLVRWLWVRCGAVLSV